MTKPTIDGHFKKVIDEFISGETTRDTLRFYYLNNDWQLVDEDPGNDGCPRRYSHREHSVQGTTHRERVIVAGAVIWSRRELFLSGGNHIFTPYSDLFDILFGGGKGDSLITTSRDLQLHHTKNAKRKLVFMPPEALTQALAAHDPKAIHDAVEAFLNPIRTQLMEFLDRYPRIDLTSRAVSAHQAEEAERLAEHIRRMPESIQAHLREHLGW